MTDLSQSNQENVSRDFELPHNEEQVAGSYTKACDRLIKAFALIGIAAITYKFSINPDASPFGQITLLIASVIILLAASPLFIFWLTATVLGLEAKIASLTFVNNKRAFWISTVFGIAFLLSLVFSLVEAVRITTITTNDAEMQETTVAAQ